MTALRNIFAISVTTNNYNIREAYDMNKRQKKKQKKLIIKKTANTSQMFEQFYGKPFPEITLTDIGDAEKIEWGEDVGGELL